MDVAVDDTVVVAVDVRVLVIVLVADDVTVVVTVVDGDVTSQLTNDPSR